MLPIEPDIILGPPGTGKTTRLLGMVEQELASGTQPERIGFVSFTRKAAHEAVERAVEKFGLEKERFTWFRTLHSLAFRAMGMRSQDILEGDTLREFGDWIGIEVTGKYSIEEGTSFGFARGDRILFMENLSRIREVTLRQQYDLDGDDLSWFEVERVSRGLAEFKRAKGLHDYTDMLQMFARQDWSPEIDVLFVDEAQDLSMLQWHVVEKLASRARRLIIAGDDDQAIYNWAGAAVDYFVELPGRVQVLDQSWRVPQKIQAVADQIIGRVRHRRPKHWAPRPEEGVVQHLPLAKVDWSEEDILVLARNVVHLEGLARDLRQVGRMYEHRGHPSIGDKMRASMLAWERLRAGQAQPVREVLKAYDQMSSGLGVRRGYKTLPGMAKDALVTLQDLEADGGLMRTDVWHDAFDRVPLKERQYIRSCLRKGEKMSQRPRIRLSTIHGAKGGEADTVVLIPDMANRTWVEAEREPEAEARVWYVAVTRARKKLIVVHPQTSRHFTLPS